MTSDPAILIVPEVILVLAIWVEPSYREDLPPEGMGEGIILVA